MAITKSLRTCLHGHEYYKSSDCPSCSQCESVRSLNAGFLAVLAAPARRALENAHITTLKQLSQYSEGELLKLHGFGKSSLPKLKNLLAEKGLRFKP